MDDKKEFYDFDNDEYIEIHPSCGCVFADLEMKCPKHGGTEKCRCAAVDDEIQYFNDIDPEDQDVGC